MLRHAVRIFGVNRADVSYLIMMQNSSSLPLQHKRKLVENKVASFKRSQCEGCSIIIHLMALHDYYLKYIQGRHIKHTLKLFIWVEPSGRGFKINEVSDGFSWCHISFLWPKVTETGKVVTVNNFSIRLFILFMSKINRNQENVKFANFRYVIKIYTFVCLKLIGTEYTWSQTIVTSLPW